MTIGIQQTMLVNNSDQTGMHESMGHIAAYLVLADNVFSGIMHEKNVKCSKSTT